MQGADLRVGDTATVAWEPRKKVVGALDITVRALQRARIDALSAFRLTPAQRGSSLFYVRGTVRNVGDTDLAGVAIPLYVVDGRDTLIEAQTIGATFKPCPSAPLPTAVQDRQAHVVLPDLPGAGAGPVGAGELPADPGVRPDHLGRRGRAARADEEEAAAERLIRSLGDALGESTHVRHRRAPAGADAGQRPRRHPRRAGADGGHHQRGVPAALPGADGRAGGHGSLRLRDDHQPRTGRGRRDDQGDAGLRRARGGALGAALRHRPDVRRSGRPRSCARSTASPTST